MINEKFEEKEYLSKMSMSDARMMFRIRSKTNDAQMSQQSNKNNAKISGNVGNAEILTLKATLYGACISLHYVKESLWTMIKTW